MAVYIVWLVLQLKSEILAQPAKTQGALLSMETRAHNVHAQVNMRARGRLLLRPRMYIMPLDGEKWPWLYRENSPRLIGEQPLAIIQCSAHTAGLRVWRMLHSES